MKKKTTLWGLLVLLVAVVVLNMVVLSPVQQPPVISVARTSVPTAQASSQDPRGVSPLSHSDGSAAGDESHLAWHHSLALQRKSQELVEDGSALLLRTYDEFHAADPKVGHHELSATCGYMASKRHGQLKSVDYSHRVKRKGEYSTSELYQHIKQLAGRFVEFGNAIPVVVNQYPVQLSSEFDLAVAFGSWGTKFAPVPGALVPQFYDNVGKTVAPVSRPAHRSTPSVWLKSYHSPQRVDAQPPAFVAMFHDAVVSHGHVVTCKGDVLTAGGCLWDFHLPAIHDTKDVHSESVAVALCDEWCKGYYHFTHEHLPRLAVVHRLLLERNDTKLVLSHSPNGFQRQFLTEVLGIPATRIIHGKAVLGDTVVYPQPMRCGNTFTTMLYLIRRIVYDRLDLGEGLTIPTGGVADSAAPPKLRLLFAERKHLSRMPTNYFELKAQLERDFEEDFTFTTTVGESDARHQIELFHQADVVVGPHGANIANMMWMRHGTHVIEIASRRKGNMCYYATASRINVTHHLVLHDKGKDAKYSLPYDYLKSHVAHALRIIRRL